MCGVLLYAIYQTNTAFKRIRSAMDKKSAPWVHVCRYNAVRTVYLELQKTLRQHRAAYVAVTLHDCLVCLERHGNATATKAYVAVTLDDRLIREGWQRFSDSFKQLKKQSPYFRSSFDSSYIRQTYVISNAA